MARPIISGIYAIIHVDSARIYVGSALSIYDRWANHRSELNRGIHGNGYLRHAWRKYGADAFEWRILEIVNDPEQLLEREQWWMDLHQSAKRHKGFNIAPKAGSSLGIKRTPEERRAMGERQRGRRQSEYQKQAVSRALKGNLHGKDRHYHGILTESDVIKIKHRLAAHERAASIAADFRVTQATVLRIANRDIWWNTRIDAALEAQIDSRQKRARGEASGMAKLTTPTVVEIKKALAGGEQGASIARRLNISTTMVCDINRSKTWRHVLID